MAGKTALFAFNGETMCFVHVLLNGLDLLEKGREARIVVEGSATRALVEASRPGSPFHALYTRAREVSLLDGACKACSTKMGVDSDIRDLGLPLLADMSGHPSVADYLDAGYVVLTI